MRKLIILAILLVAAGAHAGVILLAGGFTLSNPQLRWAPPALSSPSCVNVSIGTFTHTFGSTEDGIYVMPGVTDPTCGANNSTTNPVGAGGCPPACVRTGSFSSAGGQKIRMVGGDNGPHKFKFQFVYSSLFLEGVRADMSGSATPVDCIAPSGPGDGIHYPTVYVQAVNCNNVHGYQWSFDSGIAVTNTSFSAPTTTLTLAGAPGANWCNGATVRLQLNSGAFVGTFTLATGSSGSATATITDSTIPVGATGTAWSYVDGAASCTTPAVVGMNAHADGLQVQVEFNFSPPSPIGLLNMDSTTINTNYQGVFLGQLLSGDGMLGANISRTNFTLSTFEPQAAGSIFIYNADGCVGTLCTIAGGGTALHLNPSPTDFKEVYSTGRASQSSWDLSVYPNSANSPLARGSPFNQNVTFTLRGGGDHGDYLASTAGVGLTGTIKQGIPAGGDFAPYSGTGGLGIPGVNYVSRGYQH